jgi:hypothetical protein
MIEHMFVDLTDEALELELCTEAAQLSAGECHLLSLLAELNRREIWAQQGARSCAHWLSWRVGTALGAAREQLRVAKALERLEATRAAFARGELSYSKVRAITRVADASNDAELVELARHATAAQLEEVVRAYRRCDPDEQAKANANHARRFLRHRSDEDGMVLITARLDPEEAAVVLQAIELARAAADEREVEEARGEAASSGEETRVARQGQRHGHVSSETSDAAGAAPEQESERFDVSAETSAEAGAEGPEWTGEPFDISAEACPGAVDEAGERFDVSAETSGDDDLEPDTLLDRQERAAADALVELCNAVLAHGLDDAEGQSYSVIVHVDEAVLTDPGAAGCSHLEGLGAITAHAAARLSCEGAVTRLLYRRDGSVEQIGATRVVPTAMRRALLARDRTCRFPGCGARRFLHAHHVVYASRGGRTALSNLVTLCGPHHRLVHDGGYRLSLRRGGQLRVLSPSGAEVPSVPSSQPGSCEGLVASNRSRGVQIDPETLRGDGEVLDLGLTIDGLFGLRARTQLVEAAT